MVFQIKTGGWIKSRNIIFVIDTLSVTIFTDVTSVINPSENFELSVHYQTDLSLA
jgi:hypothetical protein